MKTILLLLTPLLLISCVTAKKAEPVMNTLEAAIASENRTPAHRVRDIYRHPLETLKFFGLEPQMTVVEIGPSAGWYTEILAPYLAPQGQYIAAETPSSIGDFMQKANDQRKAWLNRFPDLAAKVKTTSFNPPQAEVAPAGSADMVLTFRNVHNWMASGIEQAAFEAFFKALKPGGILGVVEHRAFAKQKRDAKAKSGYVRERDVIQMAELAGFKLVAKSEINANPKDTKDYPDGVWTLPPTLRLKEQDREKYLNIGESDRMTLKFVKPMP